MKGVVFTEFLELVEDQFGLEMVDGIISDAKLENDGAYTAVGTYHHAELVRLVVALEKHSQIAIPDLLKTFGKHLFQRFSETYPILFDGIDNAFDFLAGVHGHIHVEVRKLYPEAELPDISAEKTDQNTLKLHYKSSRPFADFAEGLVRGCIEYYGEPHQIQVLERAADNTYCEFMISKAA